MVSLTITRPDDWHLHLRDTTALASVVGHSAERFARAIIMPNLSPPISTTAMALDYRRRIVAALPEGSSFEPLMTLYLTDNTTPDEIALAAESGHVTAVKLYPAGSTTNSADGVTDLTRISGVVDALVELQMPLLVHGEVTASDIDIFDRERVFLEQRLQPLLQRHPDLRVVFEHITTGEAADFVRTAGERVAATITPQHLLMNRNDLLVGGMRPHHYCLPVLKREGHREALMEAATSGNPSFFLGTDSAPHTVSAKESRCGCAGIYSAHAAIELYAEAFAAADALDRLEGFASHHGADFYHLPRNRDTITLEQAPWTVPESYPFGSERVVPLRAGGEVKWRLAE